MLYVFEIDMWLKFINSQICGIQNTSNLTTLHDYGKSNASQFNNLFHLVKV